MQITVVALQNSVELDAGETYHISGYSSETNSVKIGKNYYTIDEEVLILNTNIVTSDLDLLDFALNILETGVRCQVVPENLLRTMFDSLGVHRFDKLAKSGSDGRSRNY